MKDLQINLKGTNKPKKKKRYLKGNILKNRGGGCYKKKEYQKDVKRRRANNRERFINGLKTSYSDVFNDIDKDHENELHEGIKENLKKTLQREKMVNLNHAKNTFNKDSFEDVDDNNMGNEIEYNVDLNDKDNDDDMGEPDMYESDSGDNDKLERFEDSYEQQYMRRKRGRESFQSVQKRSLNPNNEDESNLLITQEIFTDLQNRIRFNYESIPYLKIYIS